MEIEGGDPGKLEALRKHGASLKSCPDCIESHIKEYGTGYWVRIHQVPTVLACPIHGCRLHTMAYTSEQPGTRPLPESLPATEKAQEWEIHHAKNCQQILDGFWMNHHDFAERIWFGFTQIGLASETVDAYRLRLPQLKKVLETQRWELVKEIAPRLQKWDNQLHLNEILDGKRQNIAANLALLSLSNLKIADLKVPSTRSYNFPCRNIFAPCYLKLTARRHTKRIVSDYIRCQECGFDYIINRKYAHLNAPDKSPPVTIISGGPIWESVFRRMWMDKTLTNQEIWVRSGIGRSATERMARALGLPKRTRK